MSFESSEIAAEAIEGNQHPSIRVTVRGVTFYLTVSHIDHCKLHRGLGADGVDDLVRMMTFKLNY